MYSQKDLDNVNAMLKKRWLAAAVPAGAALAVGIAVFVYGNAIRSDKLWMVTLALTILGGGYFLFLLGTWIKPALIYRKHVNFMLNGRKRVTEGILTEIASETTDRDGLECYAMNINVGKIGDPEDDRLLYWDVYKERPDQLIGRRVSAESNDKSVSSIREVVEGGEQAC